MNEGLGTVASGIGRPHYQDAITKACTRLDFTRVCVMLDISSKLPKRIVIMVPKEDNEGGGSKTKRVRIREEPIIRASTAPPNPVRNNKYLRPQLEMGKNVLRRALKKAALKVVIHDERGSLECTRIEPSWSSKGGSRFDFRMSVLVSVVYGGKDLGVRRDLWRILSHIVDSIDVKYWLVLGDFNAVADMSEVCGASGDIRLVIEGFQRFLIDTSLITLPMQGALLTWHNCNDTSRSLWKRLDRVLVKDQWLDRWSSAFNVSFTPRTSDHSPSILKGN
ncbi:UNVERIFIED_CONTAM: hypothetical protein Sangu_0201300 [Sesamum angustifolium]|uniref:Endonuclease/exonuclease/phosphatase domain-containing protein n=1 Tax=Sesamum angustifolium TaxID=2727405 RepID=A0AAW2RMU1_9LAMI